MFNSSKPLNTMNMKFFNFNEIPPKFKLHYILGGLLVLFLVLIIIEKFLKGLLIKTFDNTTLSNAAIVVTATITLITFSSVVLEYLNAGNKFDKKTDSITDESLDINSKSWESLAGQFADLRKLVYRSNQRSFVSNEERQSIIDSITKSISDNLSDNFITAIEEKYDDQIKSEARYRDLIISFSSIISRLEREIYSLSRRSNLNLVIGMVTTAIAVLILIITFFYKDQIITDWRDAAKYFIPRISITIFIEVFSFFFLRLYRSNLGEIKYYQNELTNADFKILALKSAIYYEDQKSISAIIKEFIKVERNFVLKKGETTVEIEAFKNSNQYDESFFGIVKNISDKLNQNTVRVKPKKKKKAEPER